MEKNINPASNPLARQVSYDGWSVQDAPHSPYEGDTDIDIEHDAEPTPKEPGIELSRTVSGPPYTIFSSRAKMFIVLSVSVSSLISPFGATTFYPALNVLAADLKVTPTLVNLALTTYMVSLYDVPSAQAIDMLITIDCPSNLTSHLSRYVGR
jgi:hypothetical protein